MLPIIDYGIALSTFVLLVRYHPLLLRGMRQSIGNTTYMFQLLVLGILYVHSDYSSSSTENWDCGSHDRMVVLLMVFNATFNNISGISWRPVLLVETGVPEDNHRPVASH
jgi:hypothetical protein